MRVIETGLPGVLELRPIQHGDDRGFFSETWRRDQCASAGIDADFVQDNHSRSARVGTIRGLHFQSPPFAQSKLVRVTKGAVLDVAVDIRAGSTSYGQHIAVRLDAKKWNQLFVPKGFAHGFCTLEPDTEVLYKVDAYYAPDNDHGLAWNDPALGINWPVNDSDAILSEKDRIHPTLSDLPTYFNIKDSA